MEMGVFVWGVLGMCDVWECVVDVWYNVGCGCVSTGEVATATPTPTLTATPTRTATPTATPSPSPPPPPHLSPSPQSHPLHRGRGRVPGCRPPGTTRRVRESSSHSHHSKFNQG